MLEYHTFSFSVHLSMLPIHKLHLMDLRGGGKEVKGYLGHEPYEPYFANHQICFQLNRVPERYDMKIIIMKKALRAGTKMSASRASWSKSEIKSCAIH